MKKGSLWLASLVLGAASLAHAQPAAVCNPVCAGQPPQCCAVPIAPFLGYESAVHNSPIFRTLSDGDTLVITTPIVVNGPKVNYSVTIGTLPALSFSAAVLQQKWTTSTHGDCFTIKASGFEDPKGETVITDPFGAHTINVNKPAFLCGDPQSSPLICFQDKEIACVPTPPGGTCLPPNTDRDEDVCAVATVL